MLRINAQRSAKGAVKYFDDGLAKSDYYSEKGEIIGKWDGQLAKRLALKGEIQREEFIALANNIHPGTKKQLTARHAHNRRVGYDFTFDVPKSVSIIYSQTQDKDILKAFDQAVDDTMLEIESNASTRVRLHGKNENRTTANLLWGKFTHEEARPVGGIPDPHLHQHVFIFNATYDQKERKFKAVQFGDLKADAAYYETVFHSRLANNLQKAGYAVERSEKHFEVKNFERSTIDKFSNRTREINSKAQELGIQSDKDKDQLGALTRANKRTGFDKEDIRLQWRSRLSEKELELIHSAKGDNEGGTRLFAVEKKKGRITAKEAFDYALDHAMERKSVVGEKELMILGLQRSLGSVTPEGLRNELKSRKDLFSKEDEKARDVIYTTPEAIEEEKSLRDSTRRGKGIFEPVYPDYRVKNEKMTAEQTAAVQHVLKSRDFITVVAGGAGTGKTWSIKEVAGAMKEKQINFGAFAPSSAASRQVQRGDGFNNATTIAELLQSKKLQDSVKDGYIWVDEAGMVGNKTMNQVIKVAKDQNARILLTGDIKQHGSVERGDTLRIIEKFGGIKPAKISKIQRQKNETYRSAVKSISDGNIEKGYTILEQMGAIKEADDFEQTRLNVAKEYTSSIKAKDNVLIVATTHAQGKAVTETIRDQLKSQKILKGKERTIETHKNLSYTNAQKQDPANYKEGMVIQFHQNLKGVKRGAHYLVSGKDDKGNILLTSSSKDVLTLPMKAVDRFSVYRKEEIALAKGDKIRITQNGFSNEKSRLNNGNILSVKGFDTDGNILATTGKKDITIDKQFGNLTHGYYTTSPASQGKSVNRVIIMQSSHTGKAASKEQFYVSASRGKFAISIHTDDKQSLLNNVQRSSHRMTASEVAEQKQSTMMDKLKIMGSLYRTGISKLANAKERLQNSPLINIVSKPPQPIKNVPVRSR